MTEKVEFKKEDIINVIKHINELVVSLDRIDSAHQDTSKEEWNNIIVEYFLKSNSLKALSTCRTILSKPFSRELGADDMDELERAMEDVEYWSYNDYCKKHKI